MDDLSIDFGSFGAAAISFITPGSRTTQDLNGSLHTALNHFMLPKGTPAFHTIEIVASGSGFRNSLNISSLSYTTATVPEVGTWAMMIVGCFASGLALRRQRTAVRFT